jgi:hypothetical protein
MKTIKSIFLVSVCVAVLLAGGCSNDNEPGNGGGGGGKGEPISSEQTIVGRWKLIEVSTMLNSNYDDSEIIDYSGNNIVYDFQINNKLVITGFISGDLQEGEHLYEYIEPSICPTCLPAEYNLKIDNDEKWFFSISSETGKMSAFGKKTIDQVIDESGLVVEPGDVSSWNKIFIRLN